MITTGKEKLFLANIGSNKNKKISIIFFLQEKAADDDDDDVVTDDCIFDRKLMENKKHKQTNKKSYEFHLLFAYF